jgi:hypothetical protein
MMIIRTVAGLTRHDLRRFKRRYEIVAMTTRHSEQGEVTEITCRRDDPEDAIRENEPPF